MLDARSGRAARAAPRAASEQAPLVCIRSAQRGVFLGSESNFDQFSIRAEAIVRKQTPRAAAI